MKLKGIDVSQWQNTIDWNKVKNDGIDFVILSVGYGDNITSQDDKQFKRNADECTRLGIPFGVYIYSYAMNVIQAKSEAEHVLRLIKGYKLDYPVYYDLEDAGTTGRLSNYEIGRLTEVFCNTIKANGYYPAIYANTYWFNSKLTEPIFKQYDKWVAQYASSCQYKGDYQIWQYTDGGKVNGISGGVDMNYCYIDYPTRIHGKKEETEKVVSKMKYAVCYCNEVDERFAKQLRDYLGDQCQALDARIKMNWSGFAEKGLIAVGGNASPVGFSSMTTHKIAGDNRYSTADLVNDICLGKRSLDEFKL